MLLKKNIIIEKRATTIVKTKVIFSPQLAQYLLHNNFIIVDIKPKHNFPNETVFVFKVESDFEDCIQQWFDKKE